jgi:outer membrane protein OmpA-like peptidoglycan-associated protein
MAADPNDAKGSKDPPLFNRMPGFYIYRSEDIDFDKVEFPVGANKTEIVEGHHYFAIYYAKDGIKQPSGLQVTRNYVNAVTAIGGQQVYGYEDGGTEYVILKVVKNNVETWARVSAASNGIYNVDVVQKQAMNQDVVANAASLAGSIKDAGKVAIYGIYFDTAKAVIKPESEPSLKEIAKMLQTDPKLKVYIVGHTDNVGTFDSNMKLSKDRADAVVKALAGKYNIGATRLQAGGVGPLSPAASNLTEEGRAKNRRVELVAQ